MKTRSDTFDAKPLFRPRLLEIFKQPYGRSDLLADVTAGITVGLIALPLALALGIASVPSGMETPYPPPAIGLFTAIFAGLVISSLGGSRVQIGGPTATFIRIVLLIIEKHGYSGLRRWRKRSRFLRRCPVRRRRRRRGRAASRAGLAAPQG